MHINRGVWAEINLNAINNNIKVAKASLAGGAKLCAVVKADAYGHGAVRVAQECMAAGADFLAVALLQEGVILRDAGIEAPILVLGSLVAEEAETCVKYDIAHACYDEARLLALNEAALKLGKKAKIHIKLDTGMHRIGVKIEDAGKFAALAKSLPGIEIEGCFSHFATADEESKAFSDLQFARYQEGVKLIEAAGVQIPIKHIANSAGIAELPQYHLDMARQGISLYGMRPGDFPEIYKDYEPAMIIKAQIAFVKELEAGEPVGYGRTKYCERKTRVATLGLGYADGFNRHLSNKGYCVINGKKAPILGRICMDQSMIDVTEIPEAQVGTEVIVMGGRDLPMEDVAELAGTNPHEICCDINWRVPRVYVRK
ncbi:MAG: alanine racemase [Phascolarctobacterium sp.]|nr:alanine racemase [Phascolarctobacterium sp.]